MANIEKFVISDKSSVRVSYFSISFGNFNLTPIPPKYIKSVNVNRYENDNAGTFEIDLVMPLATFESNSVSDKTNFTTVLSTMIASTQTANEEEAKMTFLYGWQNGAQVIVKDATISKFEYGISLDAGSNELISYKIGGVAAKVTNRLFEKHFYSISQFDILDKELDDLSNIFDEEVVDNSDSIRQEFNDIVSDPSLILQYPTGYSINIKEPTGDFYNDYLQNTSPYENFYITESSGLNLYDIYGEAALSNNDLPSNPSWFDSLVDWIANIPWFGSTLGDTYTTSIDALASSNFGINPSEVTSSDSSNSSSDDSEENLPTDNNPNYDNFTDIKYNENQRSLFTAKYGESFQISSAFVEPLAKYLYGDIYPNIEVEHIDRVYDVNTEFDKIYSIITDIKNIDKSYATLKEVLDKLVSLCYVDSEDLVNDLTTEITTTYGNVDAFSTKLSDLKSILSLITAKLEPLGYTQADINSVYTAILNSESTSIVNSGMDNLYYEMKFDSSYNGGTIWIGVNNVKDVQPKTYIISNNYKTSDVISFSVDSNGLPGYAAIMKTLNTSNAGVEASSGLTFVTKTDTGGKVPMDRVQAKDMSKSFLSKVAEDISQDTSEATLVLFGSNDTINVTVGKTVIRVMPLLNNGKTLWCGDYTVMEIHDTVNENGFTTTFKLRFDKSLFYSELFDEYSQLTDQNTGGYDISGSFKNHYLITEKDILDRLPDDSLEEFIDDVRYWYLNFR